MYTYVNICVCIFNVCGKLDKTLQDADLEKQVMFHALKQVEQDCRAYLVLTV